MSRAEEITSEVRKLVLTCRTLEAQLQQSIPKKTHQETVAKMQAIIDGLNAEAKRTKGELEKTITLGERINTLASQISVQNETIANQNKIIDSLSSKLSQSTVPSLLYYQSLSKIQELEEKVACMVERAEYNAVQRRCAELTEQLNSMVPKSEYLSLEAQFANFVPKSQFEELERAFSLMIPKEQYEESEAKIRALEARLANSVSKSDYDELAAKIASLAREASSTVSIVRVEEPSTATSEQLVAQGETPSITLGEPILESVQVSEGIVEPIVEPVVPASAQENVIASSEQTTLVSEAQTVGATETAAPEVQQVTSITTVETPTVASGEAQKTEISEIQTQLAEIKGATETGQTTYDPFTNVIVDSSLGFNFHNTSFCARSGLEFLQDLEQVPIETIESHTRNGDFERWFKEVLADDASAESLRSVRESSFVGEELRARTMEVIAPKYRNYSRSYTS